MAGKTRRHAPVPSMPRGHMELKSSALCTTNAKLVSQYLVVEHMAAHYKKLNEAKSRIDSTSPKAWAVSTKVRDRFRREALREDISHHQAWLSSRTARPSSRASSSGSQGHRSPRAHYTARLDDGHFDDIDGAILRGHSPMDREKGVTGQLRLSEDDVRLVNQIIQDSRTSPSKYHHRQMPSSIPPATRNTKTGQAAHHMTLRPPKSQLLQSYTTSPNYLSSAALGRHQGDVMNRHVTPRCGDLLEKQAHKFTEEKPFMPRTLKTNCTSKLTEFKYYNPPPKKHVAKSWKDTTRGGAGMLRSETPMTESVDLMHETLLSRDAARAPPSDIPPLDISLDADHLLWLQEQSKMAQLRKSHKYAPSRPTSSISHHLLAGKSQKFYNDTKPLPKTRHSLTREDELRYLEFISDVTNDVLDRGIFTNRVLKQVFESHIEKRKDLKESKMRELLDDLWKDLGISPDEDNTDSSPVTKHPHPTTYIDSTTTRKPPMSDVTPEPIDPVPPPRAAHRQRRPSPTSPSSPKMPTLRAAPRGQKAKPALSSGGSVRSQCEDDVSEVCEEDEEERRTQRETADMMAAILKNGTRGVLQPSDTLSTFDMVDTDEISAKEHGTVSSNAVENEVHAVPRDVVVTKENPTLSNTSDSAEDLLRSPVNKEVEEQVTSPDNRFPTERAATPENEITTNEVESPRDLDTDRPRDLDTDRPREVDTDRTREVDTDRPRDLDTDRPRDLDTDRPRDLDTDRPREVDTDRTREVDTDRPPDQLTNGKEEPENADDKEEWNVKVDEKNTKNTEKDNPVFNNNENEQDTARSGCYTDDGWESNLDDDDSEDEDTLRGSGNKGKGESQTHREEEENSLPRATQRLTNPVAAARSNIKDAPKSLEQTMSSESLDVSDLDEDDDDF